MNNYSSAYPRRSQMAYPKTKITDLFSQCTSALPENPVVAMAYVPFQTDSSTYDEMKALQKGTLYPVLYKPFLGCGVR